MIKLLIDLPPQRIMRREKHAEGWTWIPAEAEMRGRSARGRLALAIACLAVGIVIGRVSSSTQDDHSAEQGSTPAQVSIPTVPEDLPEPSGWSKPEPSTAKAEAPTLALGSEDAWTATVMAVQEARGGLRRGSCFHLNLAGAPLAQKVLGEPVQLCAGFGRFVERAGWIQTGSLEWGDRN